MFNPLSRILAAALIGAFVLTQAAVTSAWTPTSPQVMVSVFGGTGWDYGRSVAVDSAGNIYTTGTFSGTVDFDPGPGTANLLAVGGNSVFVSKLDVLGNFVWARSFAGESYGYSLAVDLAGNVYTTGEFRGTVDFDPDADATTNLISAGNYDVFVSKLNAAGNFVWAKSFGGSSVSSVAYSLAVDSAGNVYTTGEFSGTVDFNPVTVFSNLTSVGSSDVFVLKLDAAGNFVWAKSFGGTGDDYGISLAVDSAGNVYTTGEFSGTVDFDPDADATTNLASAGNYDVFVSKLDASGNFVWAKKFGGTGDDYGLSLAVDSAGNVYTTGSFDATVDFDPGAGTTNLISAGSGDVFVTKLNASGNFVWAKSFGGTGNDRGSSLAVDSAGNVYTTGSFLGTVDFDPGAGTTNLTSAGNLDVFVLKLDELGSAIPTTTTTTTTTTPPPVVVRAAATTAPLSVSYRAANKSVSLRWGAVTGAASYVVTTTRGTQVCATTATKCVVSRLRNGRAYNYLMFSVNTDGVRSETSTRITARPGFQVKNTTVKAKRTVSLSSIVTTPSRGTKSWRVMSGACRIQGTRLVASPTRGTCRLRLATAKAGSYAPMSTTISITITR